MMPCAKIKLKETTLNLQTATSSVKCRGLFILQNRTGLLCSIWTWYEQNETEIVVQNQLIGENHQQFEHKFNKSEMY